VNPNPRAREHHRRHEGAMKPESPSGGPTFV
jgi:hypothetical protein